MISEKARQVLLSMAEHYERDPETHLQNGVSERVLGAETRAYLGAVYHEIHELVNKGFVSRLDPLNINSKVIITQQGYRYIRPAHVRFFHRFFEPKTVTISKTNPPTPSPQVVSRQKASIKYRTTTLRDQPNFEWDAFICHATEDKGQFVRELADKLREKGLRIWYDEFTLKVGDSLRQSIDKGLANSKYGIVVLSPNFFTKKWPQDELNGLAAKERNSQKVILPVWLDVDEEYICQFSPMLADRFAAKCSTGMGKVINDLLAAIKP
jgi:hypothetical protein